MSAEYAACFLVGPTASGKTAVAQWMAEREGFDILSADSMLVYEGMDIGTAKPTAAERARVAYHGLDVTTPDRPFSVWDYSCHAHRVLADAEARGRRVLVVGGTGLYVKSLTHGLRETPAPDPALRAQWDRILRDEGAAALQEALRLRRPDLYAALRDPANGRRLIRALELAQADAAPPGGTWRTAASSAPLAGLQLSVADLHSRIESRVGRMYNAGFIGEVEALLRRYPVFSETARQAIGYAEAMDVLAGRCSREEAVQRTIVRTRQLAKRQMTWFRRQADVRWIRVTPRMGIPEIAVEALEHWRQWGPTPIRGAT